MFEQHELPGYAAQLAASDEDIDQWALTTLRFIQYQQLKVKLMPEMAAFQLIPGKVTSACKICD